MGWAPRDRGCPGEVVISPQTPIKGADDAAKHHEGKSVLIGLANEGFEAFKAAWEAEASDAGQALRKALRIAYYLVKHVWSVDDVTIADRMNDAEPPADVVARKFRHDWVKPFVAVALDGRDLANRDRLDNLHDYPRGGRFTPTDAWRFTQALQALAKESETPLGFLTADFGEVIGQSFGSL